MSINFLWIDFIVVIWLGIITFFLVRMMLHYQHLTNGIEKKDLKSLLEEILKRVKAKDEQIQELFALCSSLEKDALKHIQKVGFLRYNPFSDTGGDQSFILALLDSKDNGLIISSFHGRDGTRIYAKSVKKGSGENFALSDEEEKVIKQAKFRK